MFGNQSRVSANVSVMTKRISASIRFDKRRYIFSCRHNWTLLVKIYIGKSSVTRSACTRIIKKKERNERNVNLRTERSFEIHLFLFVSVYTPSHHVLFICFFLMILVHAARVTRFSCINLHQKSSIMCTTKNVSTFVKPDRFCNPFVHYGHVGKDLRLISENIHNEFLSIRIGISDHENIRIRWFDYITLRKIV